MVRPSLDEIGPEAIGRSDREVVVYLVRARRQLWATRVFLGFYFEPSLLLILFILVAEVLQDERRLITSSEQAKVFVAKRVEGDCDYRKVVADVPVGPTGNFLFHPARKGAFENGHGRPGQMY
jgi:hypothetical protein